MDKEALPEASTELSFERLFSNSLSDSLVHMLGEKAAAATVRVLKLKEVEEDPIQTLSKLRRLFGAGSQVIERVAMREFFIKLGIQWDEEKSSDTSHMLKMARESYSRQCGSHQ
ncbi:MAG: hypothetical protein JRN68_10795 [Nitrososphaerota archaeon]|nr:hypothetical protein [Nitrososphaerota archaeon]